MKLNRYKEIIISFIIIVLILITIGIKNFSKYKEIEISNNNILQDESNIQQLEANTYDIEFDKRVENRDEKIFLKDFENYKPTSSEIKLSQAEAEKIADIGFIEAEMIGEVGDRQNQTMRIEEVLANNFFTADHNLISRIYSNIKRKCYVFSRENDMGCGAMVYVDVTTGLIIGGQCFGD